VLGFQVAIDDYGEEYLIPTEEGQKRQRELRLGLLLKQAGITEPEYRLDQYQGADERQNIPKIKQYAAEFERFKNIHLYLWSSGNSSQKTTVAKNIILELSLQGYECQFILMADLLSLLQKESYSGGDLTEQVERLRTVDFLVIDDAFDPKKATVYKSGYQFSFLDTFLRYRLETVRKATCFTSNIPVNEINKKWTDSIMSLIERHVPWPMEFTDYLNDFKKGGIWD